MGKKYKYWDDKGFPALNGQAITHCKNKGDCPKGVNMDCNIIPRNKARMIRVKAWAWLSEDENEILAVTIQKAGSKIPCTITIDSKHLKERK